jgi:hypothetical protein
MEIQEIQKATVNNCNNCWRPIGKGEVIYRVSVNQKIASSETAEWENSVGLGNINSSGEITETWIQCGSCYLGWQKELEESKVKPTNWWLWGTLLYFVITFSAVWSLSTIYGYKKFLTTEIPKMFVFPAIFLLGIPVVILICLIFRHRPVVVNRFKLRKK